MGGGHLVGTPIQIKKWLSLVKKKTKTTGGNDINLSKKAPNFKHTAHIHTFSYKIVYP